MKKTLIIVSAILALILLPAAAQAASPNMLQMSICSMYSMQTYVDSYSSCIGHTGPPPTDFENDNCSNQASNDASRAFFGCLNFGYGMFESGYYAKQQTPKQQFTPKDPLREQYFLAKTKKIFDQRRTTACS